MEEAARVQSDSRSAGAGFLLTELETTLTFANAALSAGDNTAKRERNRANARKGYDTLIRFSQKFEVPASAAKNFSESLRQLKNMLESLGETDLE